MIEPALRSLLGAAMTAAGKNPASVYPLVAPPSADYPFLSYQLVGGGDRWPTSLGPSGFGHPRVMVKAVALSYTEAIDLFDRVRRQIDTFAGTQGGVVIRSCLLTSGPIDLDEPERSKGDETIFTRSGDFTIIFEE
jgi:hypothetical protein